MLHGNTILSIVIFGQGTIEEQEILFCFQDQVNKDESRLWHMILKEVIVDQDCSSIRWSWESLVMALFGDKLSKHSNQREPNLK